MALRASRNVAFVTEYSFVFNTSKPSPYTRKLLVGVSPTPIMTTAHRPTFDPARGKEAARGVAYHQRLLPAHTYLKHRQAGQGGAADANNNRDLRAELLEAEARHFAKKNGTYVPDADYTTKASSASKRPLETIAGGNEVDEDEAAQKRRRIEILEKYRDVDADESSDSSESSDDE